MLFRSYAKLVKQKSMLRKLISASQQIVSLAFEEEDDADVIIDKAEHMIFEIAEDRVRQGFQYVAEWGNHRIQRFSPDGKPDGVWGKGGTRPGEFYHPWGVAVDRDRHVYVADHENHRIQKFLWH